MEKSEIESKTARKKPVEIAKETGKLWQCFPVTSSVYGKCMQIT